MFFTAGTGVVQLQGHAAAVDGSELWSIQWSLTVDAGWATQTAEIRSRSRLGERTVRLEHDGLDEWRVDGEAAPGLSGCLYVDLEASACTNTFPVHRLHLAVGETVRAPAVYVQAQDLTVRRLDQTYRRLDADTFHYTSQGGFEAVLRYDDSGLIVDYPGIAVRVA